MRVRRAPRTEDWSSYWSAVYRFQRGGVWRTLTFGRPGWAMIGQRSSMPDRWGIITACNPMSRPLAHAENLSRRIQLARTIADLGIESDLAVNESPDGAWREPGLALWGTGRETLLGLAHRFGQRAVVWAVGERIGLLETATERWTTRGWTIMADPMHSTESGSGMLEPD